LKKLKVLFFGLFFFAPLPPPPENFFTDALVNNYRNFDCKIIKHS